VIDAAAFVPIGADHVQLADVRDTVSQPDVDARPAIFVEIVTA
jgi:hypothetical protein